MYLTYYRNHIGHLFIEDSKNSHYIRYLGHRRAKNLKKIFIIHESIWQVIILLNVVEFEFQLKRSNQKNTIHI